MTILSVQKYILLLLCLLNAACTSETEEKKTVLYKTADTSALKANSLPVKQRFTLNPLLNLYLDIDYSKLIRSQEIYFRKAFLTVNVHPVFTSDKSLYNHLNGFISKKTTAVYAPAQISGSGAATVYSKGKLIAINDLGHWILAGIDSDNFTKLKLLDKSSGDAVIQIFNPLKITPAFTVSAPRSGGKTKVSVSKSPAGGLIIDIYNSKIRRSFHVKGAVINEISQ